MRQYTGKSKIAAVGPCVSNFGGGYVLLDNIQYEIQDKIWWPLRTWTGVYTMPIGALSIRTLKTDAII